MIQGSAPRHPGTPPAAEERTLRSQPHGLYEPQTEHDACGLGFVAHIKGEKSRGIVTDALELLDRLSHRGAVGSDPDTGDGAGILVQIPHRFFKRKGLELGFEVPRRRRYGIGAVFLPAEARAAAACQAALEEAVEAEGQRVLGWRDVPVDPSALGVTARKVMPTIRQLYVGRRRVAPTAFERTLFVIRKRAENRIREEGLDPEGHFHVCSLSAETIVYKGLLTPGQLPGFYPDLSEPDLVSAIAVVHSRFSTNTFPTWDLAQPFRHICHNGEINTLRGNRNWMLARRAQLHSSRFDRPLQDLMPIMVPGGSDSAQFDNMLEVLHLGACSLPRAMMLMIPEAFETDPDMEPARVAFYDYASAVMEPWDGPAAIIFTDGHLVGATLDRSGLRPARYTLTTDDRLILASETGALEIPPEQVAQKGRLRPGRMLIVDTSEQRMLEDTEVKADIVRRFPFQRWLKKNTFHFENLPPATPPPPFAGEDLCRRQRAFGWSDEDVEVLLQPMAAAGKERISSMGDDTPLAVLSEQAPSLFRYLKQLFAQVTNPPLDPIRERMVMSLRTSIGGGGNPFEETPEACHRILLPHPLLTNAQLAALDAIETLGIFEPTRLSMVYAPTGPDALEEAVDALCAAAREAVDEGFNVLVLSDRAVDATQVPIPALLAVSAVHHTLVREGTRLLTGLVVETGEVREVHHLAALLGFGAGSVNPYLALDTVRELAVEGAVEGTPDQAEARFIEAMCEGLLKVMSKMGISTLESYRGAQIFEFLGLDRALVDRHFPGTPSRLQGVGLAELDQEARQRHGRGWGPDGPVLAQLLPVSGRPRWRRRGAPHIWNPSTVPLLQQAVREADREAWDAYSALAAPSHANPVHLRDLLGFVEGAPVPLDEVEPVAAIVRRFCTGAMSFGSISAPAHETLARAMNALGGRSNTGEGGEEPARFTDDRRSAVKQVASGRFGVHTTYLVNADELQIKISQGAKPGEGGQLPGHKVSARIAAVRCSTPGVTLISPPPHHDIYSIEDLAQLITDLKTVNPQARVSVKLVSEVGVGTVAAGVAKARGECVIIAGADGGTGASPLSSIQHAGLPWELGLAETQQVLVSNDLRGRIRVQVDGGLRTARDVVVATLLGAEEFGFATAPLVSLGCILLRNCHQNTCAVGVATQDPELVERFTGDPVHVLRFFTMLAEDVRALLAALGFRSIDEAVGRVDRLASRTKESHEKARRLDLSALLARAPVGPEIATRQQIPQQQDLADHLDRELIASCAEALAGRGRVELERPIRNTDRTVGAMLSGLIARRHGAAGLPDESIRVRFTGSAGQSFGAFAMRGLSLVLLGETNDYLGKGLSGGRLVVRPPPGASYLPEDNVLVGNTTLYGATSGQAFLNGLAGERFAVRNSGAVAVVEGVGDHCCEYMTGGVVLCLGPTGRNFAAGMSGGIAFVYDPDHSLERKINLDTVALEEVVEAPDKRLLRELLHTHLAETDSPLARRILADWSSALPRFRKVMPTEYKAALERGRAAELGGDHG